MLQYSKIKILFPFFSIVKGAWETHCHGMGRSLVILPFLGLLAAGSGRITCCEGLFGGVAGHVGPAGDEGHLVLGVRLQVPNGVLHKEIWEKLTPKKLILKRDDMCNKKLLCQNAEKCRESKCRGVIKIEYLVQFFWNNHSFLLNIFLPYEICCCSLMVTRNHERTQIWCLV